MRTCNAADFTTILLQFRIPPNLLIVGLRSCASLCIYVGCSLGFQSLFFVCARSSAILQIEHTTSHREIDNSCSLRIARTVSARVDRSLLLVSIYRQLYYFSSTQHMRTQPTFHDGSALVLFEPAAWHQLEFVLFLDCYFFLFQNNLLWSFHYIFSSLFNCMRVYSSAKAKKPYLSGWLFQGVFIFYIYIINALRLLTGRQILRKAVHTQYTPSFIH